jgi:hypothetical protein
LIEGYVVLATRIRKELVDLERVVSRAEGAITATRKHTQDQEFYIDSAALNLHDFYAGLERVFQQIVTTVDNSVPSGKEWHRDLLRQMNVEIPDLRPTVLSDDTVGDLDEFLRFRHIVRNVYAFSFDPVQIERLVKLVRPAFAQVQGELLVFADFLEQVGVE